MTSRAQDVVWGRLDGGQLGIQFSAQQLRDELLIRQDKHGRPRICLRSAAVLNLGQIKHVACGTDHSFIDEKGREYATRLTRLASSSSALRQINLFLRDYVGGRWVSAT